MLEYIIGGIAAFATARMARKAYRVHLRPKIKGYFGERGVKRTLRKLPNDEHEVLQDLMLSTGKDLTQIDHVVISKYGIFDIETKNFSGFISGNEWDKEWQQITDNGLHPIPNPVRQNYKHTLALKHTLKDIPGVPIYPIVVLSDKSRLDVTSERTLVVNRRDLLSAISSLCDKPVLGDAQIQQIKRRLEESNITDRGIRNKHKEQVRLKNDLFSADIVSKAYEEGKNSPIISFSPQLTTEERFLQEELDSFHTAGPVLTIKGVTDTIDGFLKNARRQADGSVAENDKSFDHVRCPYTGTHFPPSELVHLERGLWLSYLNKHPALAHHVITKDGFSEMFPKRTAGAAIISAYVKDPAGFTAKAKATAWYKNLEASFRKPSVSARITEAAMKKAEAQTTLASTPVSEKSDLSPGPSK